MKNKTAFEIILAEINAIDTTGNFVATGYPFSLKWESDSIHGYPIENEETFTCVEKIKAFIKGKIAA